MMSIHSQIIAGNAGAHGEIILKRKHYKCLYETQVIPTEYDKGQLEALEKEYKGQKYYLDEALTSWYKLDKDILIFGANGVQPLSEKSNIVKSMSEKPCQKRFYVLR